MPAWLVFEAVQTKLPHYTLPMFPALMLLGAAWAMDPLRHPPPRWWRGVARAVLVGVAAGLALLAMALPWWLSRQVLPSGLLAVVAAVLLVAVTWRSARSGAWGRAGLGAALLAVPLYAAVLEGVVPRLDAMWIAPRIAAVLRAEAPGLAASDFGITGYSEPSVVFATGAEAKLLNTGTDAARFLAAGPGRVVAVGNRAEADFRREAAALGLQPQEIGTVTGFNYSRGRWLTLILFKAAT